MSILDKISIARGTDKSSLVHNYCVKYEKYFPFKREEKLNILEIGVLNGESLRVWKDYYFNSNILGIDITKECKQYEEERIKIEIGSQIDEVFLNKIIQEYGPFDMILDDGSHINSDVIYSFEHLFGAIKSGGIYVIEDVCTSYWSIYGGERYKEGTTIEYFKNKVDEVNFFGEYNENPNRRPLDRFDLDIIKQFKEKGYQYIGIEFESLNFLNGIVLITKR
jgi:hypothetical protein